MFTQMQDVDSWSPPSDWSHCLQPDGDFFILIDGALFSERTRVIHYLFSHPNINNSRYAATRETLEAAGVQAAAPGPTRRPAPPAAPHHSTNSCFFSLSLSLFVPPSFTFVCLGVSQEKQVWAAPAPSSSFSSSAAVAVCFSVWTWRRRNCSVCIAACGGGERCVDGQTEQKPQIKFVVCQPSFIGVFFCCFVLFCFGPLCTAKRWAVTLATAQAPPPQIAESIQCDLIAVRLCCP